MELDDGLFELLDLRVSRSHHVVLGFKLNFAFVKELLEIADLFR